MINEMRDYVLDLVKAEFESGHQLVDDFDSYNSFKELCTEDGVRCSKSMFDFYMECHNLGPAGFYETYKDELDFDPDFIAEYADEDEEEVDTNSLEPINEDIDDNKVKKAVGVLYAMDNFVLSVMDNMYWLSMGVPDGEFDEVDRHAAEVNFADHDWLIVDDDRFDTDAFKDLIDAFEEATDDEDDYNQTERKALIDEAKKILSTNESVEDMDRRCETCNTLLNDMGECPKCDHGEEDILTEASPLDRLNKMQNKTDKKLNKLTDNTKLQKKVAKILAKDLSKDAATWTFYVPGEEKPLDQKDYLTKYGKEGTDKNWEARANTVVLNSVGRFIRRGLEWIDGKKSADRDDPSTFKIRKGYTWDDIMNPNPTFNPNVSDEIEVPEESASANTAEATAIEQEVPEAGTDQNDLQDSAAETSSAAESEEKPEIDDSEEVKTPNWVNDKSIKAAVTLLSKRKNSEGFFDAEGNLIDYKNIDVDNYDSIYLDKKQERSFADALKQIKDNYAKRKAAVTKNAAIFGESLDDDMSYDSIYSDYPLDEGVSYDDMKDILGLAKELGIHNGKDLITFIERERIDDEPIRDILKRYRDDLGDDFEIIEEATECSPVNEEYTDAKEIKSLVLNNEKRDHIDSIINRAANYFHINPEDLIIFEDKDFELDPGYFADDAKELTRDLIRFTVATVDVLRAKINHASLLFFKNKEEADTYIEAAKAGNI